MEHVTHKSKPLVTETDNQDDKLNYGYTKLPLELLLWNMNNGVHEGGSERIRVGWKFLLPFFKLTKHTKYAYAALLLQANLQAILSPRMAYIINVELYSK